MFETLALGRRQKVVADADPMLLADYTVHRCRWRLRRQVNSTTCGASEGLNLQWRLHNQFLDLPSIPNQTGINSASTADKARSILTRAHLLSILKLHQRYHEQRLIVLTYRHISKKRHPICSSRTVYTNLHNTVRLDVVFSYHADNTQDVSSKISSFRVCSVPFPRIRKTKRKTQFHKKTLFDFLFQKETFELLSHKNPQC